MPLRGENVGTAYVRIIADGSGLGKSIRDQFKDDDTFGGVGSDYAKGFTEGFEKDMQSQPTRDRLRKAITGPIARGKWLQDEFFKKGGSFDSFVVSLRTRYGEAGRRAGEELTEGLLSGDISLKQLDSELDNMLPRIVKHRRQMAAEAEKAANEARKDMIAKGHAMFLDAERDFQHDLMDLDRDFEERVAALHADAMKDREDMDRDFMARHNAAAEAAADAEERRITLERAYAENRRFNARQEQKDVAETTQRYRDLIFQIDRMSRGMKLEGVNVFTARKARRALANELANVNVEMERLGIITEETKYALKDHERTLHLMHPTLNKFDRGIDNIADGMGRAFGKGSRNDFINFVGSLAGGITRLVKILPTSIRLVSDFFGRASLAGKRGGPLAFLGSMAADAGKLASAIAGGLGAAFGIVGPMVAILSQLAGVVMALASTLSFTLVGAVGAAGGALLPLIAGLGVAAMGFANLEGEAKKAAKGVLEEFKDLGDRAAEGLVSKRRLGQDLRFDTRSFEQQMNFVRGMVSDLGPLVERIGSSMGYALDIFIDRIGKANGPWDKFVDSMDGGNDKIGWLATNARIAFRSITEGFGGLLGMLRALKPAGHDFLTWLRDITTRFNDWINRAEGQNAVKDFMDDALESTRAFGDFLDATWDLLRTFLDAGKDSGDSLFTSMAKAIDGWNAALQKDPDILKNWYTDAQAFGRVLGNLLVSLGDLASALDNEFSRSLATGVIDLFATSVEALADILRTVADVLGISQNKVQSFAGQAAAAALILPRLSNALGTTNSKTGTFMANIRSAETRLGALKGAARGAAGPAGLGLLIGSTQVSNDKVSTLMSTLGGAATGFAVGGPIGAAIGGAAGMFWGLSRAAKQSGESGAAAYKRLSNVDDLAVAKKGLQDLKDTLDQVTGAYTGATRAAVLKKLEETDMIETANRFNISQRTLVNAAMGQKGAMEQLYPVIGKNEAAVRNLTAQQDDLRAAQQRLINQRGQNINESASVTSAREKEINSINDQIAALEGEKNGYQQNLLALKEMAPELRKMGRDIRQTAAATADYSGLLHGIPEDIRSKIEVDGIIPSVKGVAKVAEKYDLVDRKQIQTLIKASGADATVKEVLKVINKNKELDRQRPNPKIGADPAKFNGDLANVNRALTDVGNRVVSPKISVESNVHSIVGDVNYALNSIADEVVNIVTKKKATGGITTGEMFHIGEAGAEAIVPLNRPLGSVDPSVRWLSAVAQGKAVPTSSGGKTVDVGGLTIVTPSKDPHTVATEVINQLVGSGY